LTVGYLLTIPQHRLFPFRIIAAFGMGGTETLWFSHIIRMLSFKPSVKTTWPENLLQKAIASTKPRLWTLPFMVPDYAPTALKCDLNDLVPKKEFSKVVEWELRE